MRTSPVNVVDPADLAEDDRDRLRHAADDAANTGKIDLESLPDAVRAQLLFAIEAYGRGETVAAVAGGKPLTSNEAAKLLGMSRTHLARLCEEGRIDSFDVGNALRIPSDEVMRILVERGRAKTDAREAVATADDRRRARAARAAGLA
jgi:excisionase family DNA binding protein